MISPTQSGIGGISQHVSGLTNFLKSKNHNVNVISSENTFTLPIKGLKNPSFMISAFLQTKFKQGNDIAHAHNLPASLPMKNASGKKILTLHGIYSQQIDILHGKTIGKISNSYEKEALRWADVITAVSKETCNYYEKLGSKVIHIPNAIDIRSLSEKKDKKYDKQIIFAGRLSKEKGILNLLEISKNLSDDIHLLIVGSGPEEEKVRNACKLRSNLHYLGYQPHEKTIELIRGSDVLVQPSIVEGISTTLLESMACKIPIIATKIGGNQEIIEHKKTGILVEPGRMESFLDSIHQLMSDKQFANNLVDEAYRYVQKYDWNVVGESYLSLYHKLLR
jgi:glycosyltransferase involved in cell wall biosynthesis